MDLIHPEDQPVFTNGGIQSRQLLFPENSGSRRVTVTRVTVPPETASPRHGHASSEQILIALDGEGLLLLADDRTAPFVSGDVARFEEGETHGIRNTGPVPLVYLSVTTPPINFRAAYAADWKGKPKE